MARPGSQRLPRQSPELFDALQRHVRLLRTYAERAFVGGDADYLGEVAGKLRVLVLDRGRNKPLLLKLMEECDVGFEVALNDLTGATALDLEENLASTAFAGQTSNGRTTSYRVHFGSPRTRETKMSRKTIVVSDLSGDTIEDGKGAKVRITFDDARSGAIELDVTADEARELGSKGRQVARRGRRPKSSN
jgi:hypothetical protein